MAASTELKDSLQKISALMGLLRSDLMELAESREAVRRTPVVDHIHWIADQLDELGDGLSDGAPSRSHARAKSHKATPAASSEPTSATHSGRSHSGQSRTTQGHAASGHAASSHTSKSHASKDHAPSRHGPRHAARPDAAHHDAARPSPRRHAEHRGGWADTPPIPDDPKQPDDGSDDAVLRRDLSPPSSEKEAIVPRDDAPATPPLPDVPKMPGDDKLH